MLKNPGLKFLDTDVHDANGSLDLKTDEIIQRIIRDDFADRTIIAIAHRLNTIMDFDRIAVLDKGALVECDSPAVLLAMPSSEFRRLYDIFESEGR
jgi:ATP-binding cassette subfamily C (CFTR/MRP) protein 1